MSNTLPISRIVNVDVVMSPLAAQAQDLSTLLVLGTSDIIDVVERIRTYSTLDDVATDFGTSAVEYLCAVLWFGQSPQPDQLKIGRWADTASSARLTGGVVSTANQLLSAWTGITSGSFMLPIDGAFLSVTGLNFSAATTLNGVAAIIQTALRSAATTAGVVGAQTATVVWNSDYQLFQINDAGTGTNSTIGFVEAPTATGFASFSGQPANGNTITFNGTAVEFVTTPASGKVTIGLTLQATLANLLTFLQASADAELVKFEYSLGATIGTPTVLFVKAAASGTGGNALTLAKVGANITVSGANLVGGSGTDITALLAMLSSSSGAYVADGIAAETAVAAAAIFDEQFGQTWYALTVPEATSNDHIAVAGYIEGSDNKHIYGVSTQEAGVLSAVSTTDIAYLLSQLNYDRSLVQYSSSNAYSVCSLLGRALTVNYNGNSTVITLKFKQEPGIVGENLTTTQVNALEAKNCNIFVTYNNNTVIIEQGTMASGSFIDEITGTDWLAVTTMTAIYNLLYTSKTKVQQTDQGMNLLVNAAAAVCAQGVTNGLLAPGVWNSDGFGILESGDYMPDGFYIYAAPVSSQLQADREARRSMPIQIAAKLAGAVHSVDVTININR